MPPSTFTGPDASVADRMEDWERRFRAPQVGFPAWARDAPDRLAVATDESGVWQVQAWDRARGDRRTITNEPIGVMAGGVTPDGDGIVWFHDVTGDERGHWLVAAFDGDGGAAPPNALLDGVPDGWSEGLALGRDLVAAGIAGDDGFDVWVECLHAGHVICRDRQNDTDYAEVATFSARAPRLGSATWNRG